MFNSAPRRIVSIRDFRGPDQVLRSRRSVRRLIVILRLAATILALILAVALWSGMARLSWKSDAGLAIFAALIWAYAFERNIP